ncbi:AAA family ATPase [Phytohabitans maris]|uniref:AAA family ATPase n=1 Tax=Phytohabitans maris TaxID=3071409 RepID=UPI003D179B9B
MRLPSGFVNNEVIISTEPPAAGKTTVAELLAANASVPTVHLTTDLFYRSIRYGIRPSVPAWSAAAERGGHEAIVGTVATFARGGYNVVVDGMVGPWFLPPFRALAERDHLPVSYVVLRPDLDTTLSRTKQRMGHELEDVGAITGLHSAFAGARRSRAPRNRYRRPQRGADRRSPARPVVCGSGYPGQPLARRRGRGPDAVAAKGCGQAVSIGWGSPSTARRCCRRRSPAHPRSYFAG